VANAFYDTPLIDKSDPGTIPYNPNRAFNGTSFGGGNARTNWPWNLDAQTQDLPIKDSFDQTFAFIRQNSYGCYTVLDANHQFIGNTYSGPKAGCANTGHPGGRGIYRTAELQVQGEACMQTSDMEQSNVMVALFSGADADLHPTEDPNEAAPATPSASPPTKHTRYIGLRGFMKKEDLAAGTHTQPTVAWHAAYTGCGKLETYKRLRPTSVATLPPHPFRRPDVGSDLGSKRRDLYQSGGAPKKCAAADDPNCGAPLSNYQTPDFAADLALIAVATTGVGNGGTVRAIVPRAPDGLRRFASFRYSDRNVPCDQQAVARWIFGNGNRAAETASAADRQTIQHPMFGWSPTRVVATTRTC
jgi:hypothetical protein